MVQNASTGVRLRLTTAMAHPTSELVDVPNYYLPPECGIHNHRCSILQFEHSEITYYIIPSIRSLVIVSHSTNNLNHAKPHKSFISVTENCNPTRAFYAGQRGGYRIYVACLNLQTQPHGTLYSLEYYFSPNGTQRGSVLRNTRVTARTETIYNPETVSEVIYIRDQKRCSYRDNIYFIDDSYVLQYPADFNAFDPQFEVSPQRLQECDGYESIEHYGDDNLVIRCSNGRTVLYDSCSGVFTYPELDQVPYPCMNWNTVVYRNGSKLTFEHGTGEGTQETQWLPSSDLSYGTCVQGDSPTFVGSTTDGTVFIAPLDGSNTTSISTGVHNCTGDSGICYQPVFSDDRQVFGVYNASSKEFLIVNLTVEYKQQPIILRINTSTYFSPDLATITSGKGSYNCNSLDVYDLKPESTPEDLYHNVSDTTTTAVVFSTNDLQDTVTLGVQPSNEKSSRTSHTWLRIGIPIIVVVVVIATAVVGVVLLAILIL